MGTRHQVALVVPDFSTSGGVAGVATFLRDVLEQSEGLEADIVSVALSSEDRASIQLQSPKTWRQGVQLSEERKGEIAYTHVGARASEIEYFRYQPRPVLTDRLNRYDLVQVVAGTPAWAQVCKNVECPVALQVATLARVEREATLSEGRGPKALWRRLMTRLTDHLDHRALDHVDVAFVENAWMERHLEGILGRDRVVFAPPGVDTETFTPRTGGDSDDYILSVGRFADPRKNVKLLAEAYARLRSRVDAPPLILAGRTPPTEDAWKRAEALGVRDAIEFKPDVPQSELVDLYQNAALYVVSSDEEGLGLTILEAMASGRPVVSTRCGGPSTTVVDGKTGKLVPVGDASALADAMQSLLEAPEQAEQMGRRGRRRVEQHFSKEATGNRFLKVYEQLLNTSE
jgi:glycosyltransferase involved in cell wall biosynthesis